MSTALATGEGQRKHPLVRVLRTSAHGVRLGLISLWAFALIVLIPWYFVDEFRDDKSVYHSDPTFDASNVWVVVAITALAIAAFTIAAHSPLHFVGPGRLFRTRLLASVVIAGVIAICGSMVTVTAVATAWGRSGTPLAFPATPELPATSAATQPPELTNKDVHLKALWEASRTVPLLDTPDVLGWEDPVPNPTYKLGLLLLASKALIVVVVLDSVRRLWKDRKAFLRGTGVGTL